MPLASLEYEYDSQPDKGKSTEILPGIAWVRHSLPFSLDHINVWLLFDDEQFSIVDTGIQSKRSKQHWQDVLDAHVKHHRADKIVATHLHPDHAGLAGWLCQEHGVPLYMTTSEYLLCRVLCADTGKPAPQEAISFYQRAGLDEQSIHKYRKAFGQFGRVVSELPQSYTRIQHGDRLHLGRHDWNVIVGNGHSPEHACLYNSSDNVLISGDQILPTISSIVAVWPTEPEANPLHDWLISCERLKHEIPADVLVLPAHGKPFRGAHLRLQELLDHHHKTLDDLLEFCHQPRRSVDTFDILFRSKIDHTNMVMAVGESIAHFNYLINQGQVTRHSDEHGVHWYTNVISTS